MFSGTWFADGLVGCRASRIEYEATYYICYAIGVVFYVYVSLHRALQDLFRIGKTNPVVLSVQTRLSEHNYRST